jgi:thiamine biosynthesis lipoprotein
MKTKESVLLLLFLASGCSPKRVEKAPAAWYSETRELYYRIPVTVKFTPADVRLAERVWQKLQQVDEIFNIYRADSEVARLNSATDRKGIRISDDLFAALLSALALSVETEGAFDVTVGPLVKLWKDAARTGQAPSEDAISRARSLAGKGHLKISDNSLTVTTPGVTFDFGGLVKGVAVDWVISQLKDAGCTAALVQIGGETGAFGISHRGKRHVIGVQDPTDLSKIWTAVQDPGAGISTATSGNYQQPIVIGGKVFYHIVDPRTGLPVDTHTLSVSVAFPETGRNGLADGLSTAGAVLGAEEAIPIIRRLGGEALFLIRSEGAEVREIKTEGWDVLVHDPGGK